MDLAWIWPRAVVPLFHGSLRGFPATLRTLSTCCLWEATPLPLPAVITFRQSNPLSAIKILPMSNFPRYGLLKSLIRTGRMNPDCPPPYHSKPQPQPWGEHHTQVPHNSPVSLLSRNLLPPPNLLILTNLTQACRRPRILLLCVFFPLFQLTSQQ